MSGEVFTRHGWVVVVAVDVELPETLECLCSEFIKVDPKSFSFGRPRGVAFQAHAYFVEGVYVVVNEHGWVAMVGVPVFFQQHLVQRIGVDPQLDTVQFAIENGAGFGINGGLCVCLRGKANGDEGNEYRSKAGAHGVLGVLR